MVRRNERTVSPIWPTGGVVNIACVTGASAVGVETPAVPVEIDTLCAAPGAVGEAALTTKALSPDTRMLDVRDDPATAPSATIERLNRLPPAMKRLSEIAL